ncbi:MAG: hypothetical protein AB6733_08270 [Clostridiaceae bacterium]
MVEFMKRAREIYYKECKKLFFSSRDYNKLTRPSWMNASTDNRFEATYRDQKILMKKGRIAIAYLVQANTLLFKEGHHDCPAAMVFSEDTYFEENPDKLGDIAHRIFEMKGISSEDEEIQKFSDILDDEVVTLFNAKVPEKITFGKKVYFTTFMVHRKHLPNGYIDFGSFPALICPEKTEASIILPSRYWGLKSSKQKKTLKIMKEKNLTDLLYDDPEKYVEVIQEHIEFALEKTITSRYNKAKWLGRINLYTYKKSTALIYCNKHEEARLILEKLLSNYDKNKAEENGNTLYILILGSLIDTLIELKRFEEAKEKIISMEKALSNLENKVNSQILNKSLQLKKAELDILNGDIERGGRTLKDLLESENTKTFKGNLDLCSGIYFFKKGEIDKALDYFNKASEILNLPCDVKKIQYYKAMLMNNSIYNE